MPLSLDPATGLLAPGPHRATISEVEQSFVSDFPASKNRRPIFDLWLHHRAAINSLTPIVRQWLDGSFTTSKPEPGDADVVTFLGHTDIDALPPPQQILLSGLFHGKKTKDNCRCDSYLVVEYPSGHPARHLTEKAMTYWTGVYERVRDLPAARKGFVEVE